MTLVAERPATPGGSANGPAVPQGSGSASRGRNRVTSKALGRVVTAVAADALGVAARSVHVDLADDGGLLSVAVATPVRVVSLARIAGDPASLARSGGPLLARIGDAQEIIRSRVASLTGASIGRVTITVTGIDVQPERRVR
jgi:hypothetical protein